MIAAAYQPDGSTMLSRPWTAAELAEHEATIAAIEPPQLHDWRGEPLPPVGPREGWEEDTRDPADMLAEVRRILDEWPKAEPTGTVRDADQRPTPTIYTVGELAALPSADEDYVVGEGIVTPGGKLLLFGGSGEGKTTLLHDLTGSMAMGRAWLGRFKIDRPRNVLVVQGELSLPEMASHAQQLLAAGFDTDRLRFARMTDLRLPAGEVALRDLITAAGADVVALDPWYRLFSGESSNASEQVDAVFGVADRLLEDGIVEAVIVVHHANVTGQRTAGSWIFEGWPSTIIRLEKVAGITNQRLVTFQKVRAPSSSLNGETLRIAFGEGGYMPVAPIEPMVTAGDTLACQVVSDAGGQLARHELIERLMAKAGCKERAAAKYLGQAIQGGRLRRLKAGTASVYQLGEVA